MAYHNRLTVYDALQRAWRSPEGWSWAYGRGWVNEQPVELLAAWEPDGQISISRVRGYVSRWGTTLPDLVEVDDDDPVIRRARWTPGRGDEETARTSGGRGKAARQPERELLEVPA